MKQIQVLKYQRYADEIEISVSTKTTKIYWLKAAYIKEKHRYRKISSLGKTFHCILSTTGFSFKPILQYLPNSSKEQKTEKKGQKRPNLLLKWFVHFWRLHRCHLLVTSELLNRKLPQQKILVHSIHKLFNNLFLIIFNNLLSQTK